MRAPAAVGVNVVLNVQLNPDMSNDGQLSLKLKSPALAPVRDLLLMVIVPPGPEVLVKVNDWLADDVPTICDAKVRDAGRNVTVRDAGTVKDTSFDLALSCVVSHTPPPVPVPVVADEKVNVELVGWPVEENVPLYPLILLPPRTKVEPEGKVHTAVQVTVAVVPVPVTLLTMPPTNAVTV